MKNQITELFDNLSDEQIKLGLADIKLAETTGTYSNGSILREICRQCSKITGDDTSSALMMVSIGVLKQGAYRWLDLITPNDINSDNNRIYPDECPNCGADYKSLQPYDNESYICEDCMITLPYEK